MGISYDIRISWRGDKTFVQPGDDVLGDGLVKPEVVISYGRDQSRALSPITTGTVTFRLNNFSRVFSPENTSSILNGHLDPARPMYVRATVSGGMSAILFNGHTDDFKIDPSPKVKEVAASGIDAIADLREARATTDLYPAIRTGAAIGRILDAIGWPAALRDLDVGATTVRWWSLDDEEVWTSISDLVSAEGVPALVTVDPTGKIVFRDRHHRLLRTESITSQAVFRDAGTEPLYSGPPEYDQGWRDVYNSVGISVEERNPSPTLGTIWTSDTSYSVLSGQTYQIVISSSDPFFGAITPEVGTDYQLRSGSAAITLSRTTGKSLTLSILATGDTVVDSLQVRAYQVPAVRTVQVQVDDVPSIAKYGKKTYPDNMKLACLEDAKAIASIVISYRAERLPTFTLTMIGDGDVRLNQCLSRDLSDRITIVNTELGMSRDFFIEQITHTLPLGGLLHRTQFGCEAAPGAADTPFIFDDAVNGKFGTGKFATAPLDTPTGIFIFDHATQGKFGTGLFAT